MVRLRGAGCAAGPRPAPATPGPRPAPLWAGACAGGTHDEAGAWANAWLKNAWLKNAGLKRIADPESHDKIANAVVFLISPLRSHFDYFTADNPSLISISVPNGSWNTANPAFMAAFFPV